MSQFHVVNESTEDTLESTDNLQDAIRVAREVASQGPAGDLVSILESGGKAIWQFVRLPDGTVAEEAIARPAQKGVSSQVPDDASAMDATYPPDRR